MSKTTLCMIVRNEELRLPVCLASVKGLCDELIVVDTGSTDATTKIARSFGARVFKFEWCDDFSAARNFALDKVRTSHVFRMDADDSLAPQHYNRLKKLLARLESPACYMFRVFSMQHTGDEAFSDECRLWSHSPEIRFRGRVHERIFPEEHRLAHFASECRIDHSGYEDEPHFLQKLRRNLNILDTMLLRRPVDPITRFDAARTVAGLGGYEAAIGQFEEFLQAMDARHSVAGRVAYRRMVELHRIKGNQVAAVQTAQRGLTQYPDDGVLVVHMADMLASAGMTELALEGYERAAVLCRTDRVEFGISVNFGQKIQAAIDLLRNTLRKSA